MAQNKITATTTNRAGNPKSTGLTWCLGELGLGGLVTVVEVVAGAAALRLTVGRAVGYNCTPPWLLSSAAAVPGWTLPEEAAAGEPEPADVCGLWVLAWLAASPLPAVIDNAITVLL